MVLMGDASFRLLDARGNEIAFDPGGAFTGIAPNPDILHMVAAVQSGEHSIRFTYALDDDHTVRIAQAYLTDREGALPPQTAINYYYDLENRLARAAPVN